MMLGTPHDLHIGQPSLHLQVDSPGPVGVYVSVWTAPCFKVGVCITIHRTWGIVPIMSAVLPGRFIQS